MTDTSVSKENRGIVQTNVASFITAHLYDLFAVMHVEDQKYMGRNIFSFTMDTQSNTVLARVTGMEYSKKEWDEKLASTKGTRGMYMLKNGEAIIDGSSCWGNRFCQIDGDITEERIEFREDNTTKLQARVNVRIVNVTFRGIPMAFFVTIRDVHAGEYAYLQVEN